MKEICLCHIVRSEFKDYFSIVHTFIPHKAIAVPLFDDNLHKIMLQYAIAAVVAYSTIQKNFIFECNRNFNALYMHIGPNVQFI